MNRQSISSPQLAALLLAFLLGSSIIYVPGALIGFAKNAAWISLLISLSVSCLLLLLILYLNQHFRQLTLVQISQKVLGKWVTALIMIPFGIYIFIMVTWIVIGIGGFFTSTMMRETPDYLFHSLILLTSVITARAGIEIMVRMFTLLLIMMLVFVFSVLVLGIPFYHLENLLPILPDGIKPVLHGAYFTYGFPFAEIIVFTMIIPFVHRESNSKLGKFLYIPLLINSVCLIAATLCSIMTFGPIAGEDKYPIFMIARLINIQEFIERIESVIGMYLIIGSYMKASIALFVFNLVITQVFKLRDDRILFFPLAMISFLLSLVMFRNEGEFVENFTNYWPLINVYFALIPFLIVLAAAFYKIKIMKRKYE